MIIESPVAERIVTEYEFTFAGGQFVSFLIDPKYDQIEFLPDEVKITLGEKEVNGREFDEEKITLQRPNINITVERTRKIMEKTQEQKDEWEELIVELAGGSKLIN